MANEPLTDDGAKRAVILGASRGIGLGLVRELLERRWDVVGTVRTNSHNGLHDLAGAFEGQVEILRADITVRADIEHLNASIPADSVDLLFVNAGITNPDQPIGDVPTEVFTNVMVTNALAPMRVVETLAQLVKPHGTMAVMSSRQGSISGNESGGHEAYRASKSALNQLMRSYDARRTHERTILLICPGWVQTELGGHGAQLTVEESVAGIVDTIERHAGDPGLQFLDFHNDVVPW